MGNSKPTPSGADIFPAWGKSTGGTCVVPPRNTKFAQRRAVGSELVGHDGGWSDALLLHEFSHQLERRLAHQAFQGQSRFRWVDRSRLDPQPGSAASSCDFRER